MNRRSFLFASTAALGGLGGYLMTRSKPVLAEAAKADAATIEKITRTKEEWKELLTPDQFAVLRLEATERPFTSPLNEEKRAGTFHCVGCDLGLYRSETKFDSGTGWPSFYQAIEGRVGTKTDYKAFFPRTEVHCARCEGHQGHIFDDGPPPTGMRHCINGVAITFKPDAAEG